MFSRIMWSTKAVGVVVVGLVLLLLPTAPDSLASGRDDPAKPDKQDCSRAEAEVKAFVSHYIQTLEARDEDAIRELFVADDRFAWFTDGARSYDSADDVIAGMRHYRDVRFKTTLSGVRVILLGGSHASVRSKFQTELTMPGSRNHAYGGVITWILEKRMSRGEWRVVLGHTSTPGAPPSRGDSQKP